MASEGAGSEDVPELACQPCGDDGEHIPAEGYCTDCHEYLCDTCFKHHIRARTFKHHVLQDKSKMPKTKPTSTTIDTCTQPCAQHTGEIINFYCTSHEQFGCQRCVKVGHVGCPIRTLADISEGITQSPEYKELLKKLRYLNLSYDSMFSLSETHVGEIETYHSKATEEIHAVIRMITAYKDEDLKNMSSIADTSKAVIAEIGTMTTKLEELQQKNQNIKLFVQMKNATNQIQLLEESLGKVATDNTIKRYTFTKFEQSDPDKTNQNILGQLCMLPTHFADISVSSSYAGVTGLCLLPDNQLVFSDYKYKTVKLVDIKQNKTVKLVDIKQNKIVSEVRLKYNPRDVTMIDNSQVAVTISKENTIQLLSTTSSSLCEGREIQTNGQCMGLVHNDGTLIVTFYNSRKVEIIDMNGSVLKSMTTDESCTQPSAPDDCPRYIALSPDKTAMYVSDNNNNTVTCMTMDGTVKAVYRDDNLKEPSGLAIDRTGVVYVCGRESNNVHQMTAACIKIKVILDKENGVQYPQSVAYSDKEGKLYVGMNGEIKVYKIK